MAVADFVKALDRTEEIELGTIGRVTGRESTRPVWFVRENDTVYLMPITGADSQWYRNVVQTPTVHLAAGGVEVEVKGRPITDPGGVRHVADSFRAKYGADDVAKHYRDPEVAVEAPLR